MTCRKWKTQTGARAKSSTKTKPSKERLCLCGPGAFPRTRRRADEGAVMGRSCTTAAHNDLGRFDLLPFFAVLRGWSHMTMLRFLEEEKAERAYHDGQQRMVDQHRRATCLDPYQLRELRILFDEIEESGVI